MVDDLKRTRPQLLGVDKYMCTHFGSDCTNIYDDAGCAGSLAHMETDASMHLIPLPSGLFRDVQVRCILKQVSHRTVRYLLQYTYAVEPGHRTSPTNERTACVSLATTCLCACMQVIKETSALTFMIAGTCKEVVTGALAVQK